MHYLLVIINHACTHEQTDDIICLHLIIIEYILMQIIKGKRLDELIVIIIDQDKSQTIQ
jgi:hypothetical protein